jgi:methyltransferase
MSAVAVVVALVALQRLAELLYAARNTKRLKQRGAVEYGRSHYPLFVALHACWLVAILLVVPSATAIDWLPLALFILLQAARLWIVATLGGFWTTRIISLPDAPLVRRGPYRVLRHPNYLIVIGEIALLPLAFGAWRTALAFSLLNLALLGWRRRIEDTALTPRRGLVAILAVLLLGTAAPPTRAEPPVDIALVLAVDVSLSIDAEEFALQRAGYAAAFRNKRVIDAIAAGSIGAMAVTYLQWSGAREQQQIVGWHLITDRASAGRFADTLAAADRVVASGSTSLSGAIEAAVRLLRQSGYTAERRIIDISGDGSNNSGKLPNFARDDAVAAGITINGLAILKNEPFLDTYYLANVVGGHGAFVLKARDFDDFAEAILAKLIREVASLSAQ